mmetsp:Transcript_107624/g.299796  ORF Transcript_107624/g.299796 Transcript_107624/m.299796 type:complete len:360 (+) Transcript_107624:457-1536(+)
MRCQHSGLDDPLEVERRLLEHVLFLVAAQVGPCKGEVETLVAHLLAPLVAVHRPHVAHLQAERLQRQFLLHLVLSQVCPVLLEPRLHEGPVLPQLKVLGVGHRQREEGLAGHWPGGAAAFAAAPARQGEVGLLQAAEALGVPAFVRMGCLGLLAVGGPHLFRPRSLCDAEDLLWSLARLVCAAPAVAPQRQGAVQQAPLDGNPQLPGLHLVGVLSLQELPRLLERARERVGVGAPPWARQVGQYGRHVRIQQRLVPWALASGTHNLLKPRHSNHGLVLSQARLQVRVVSLQLRGTELISHDDMRRLLYAPGAPPAEGPHGLDDRGRVRRLDEDVGRDAVQGSALVPGSGAATICVPSLP